jgi:glycosyltransferase involved in cell wall biosynthesis
VTTTEHPLSPARERGTLLIPPSRHGSAAVIDAALIAAAGLGYALQEGLGPVDVMRDGRLEPLEGLSIVAVRGAARRGALASVASRLPPVARTAAGDLRAVATGTRPVGALRIAPADRYSVVLQFHRRFERAGLRASRRLGAPLVLRVEAIETREEDSWGVRRPGFRRFVEWAGEVPFFRAADLIVPVSREVDDQLAAFVTDPARRFVLPNGVDTDEFAPGEADPELLKVIGVQGRLVIGWIGGFRPFHGLEMVRDVAVGLAQRVPNAVICLIGSGPLKRGLQDAQSALPNLRVLPAVPHAEIPRWIRAFDICLLLAGPGPFHYSPLKLREYMACGRAIVAPSVGEIQSIVTDGGDAVVVPPNDPSAVVRAVDLLARDREWRSRLGVTARHSAERRESWSARATALRAVLDERGVLRDRGIRPSRKVPDGSGVLR